jgi:NAD(P)-dependent dehydrogenase (short-subunit alcohol dehydrogenase family)
MAQQPFSLHNKDAIVTGATGLIGKEHCKALAEAGATVIAADINEATVQEFATTLPNNARGVRVDVTDKASLEHLRDVALEVSGQIDVLVNNAAINDMVENPSSPEDTAFENYPLELWKKNLDVNVTGIFLCSQIIGTHMAAKGQGSIINVASTYGMVAPDQSIYRDEEGNQLMYKSAVYPTSKGAVIQFTKFLAAYWGNKGVRVNTLSPGGVENGQADFFIENYSAKTPLGRMADKGDYRGAVVFLASDSSRYMTGANLVVDGGWTCW